MQKSVVLIVLAVIFLSFNSCNNQKKVKIGFLIHSLSNERWQADLKFLKEKAEANHAELIIKEANNDEHVQLAQALEAIKEGVDVLIVVPANQNTAAGIVRVATEANVPVISYDRLIRNAEITCLMSFDYVTVGSQMVDYAVKQIPKGNYVILWGDANDANARFIRKGIEQAIKPHIDNGNINIIYSEHIEDYSTVGTMKAMQRIYDFTNQPIDAVICGSGPMAEAVSQFFDKVNYGKHVLITGQDLTLQTCKLIQSGKQDMTVNKSIKDLAYKTMDIAIHLGKNKKLQKTDVNKLVNNGRDNIPAILLPPNIVSKQNLKEAVIANGAISVNDVFETN